MEPASRVYMGHLGSSSTTKGQVTSLLEIIRLERSANVIGPRAL